MTASRSSRCLSSLRTYSPLLHSMHGKVRSALASRTHFWGASEILAGGACRAAASPSAWSGRNGRPRTAVAPLYAALLVAARRVPPQADAAPCSKMGCVCIAELCSNLLARPVWEAMMRIEIGPRRTRTTERIMKMRGVPFSFLLAILFTGTGQPTHGLTNSFVNFETPPVHPVALNPDGSRLGVCNLADGRLE